MQAYFYNNTPVPPLADTTHTSPDRWLDQIPTANYHEHLSESPLPPSNDSVQPRSSFTISAEDQLSAYYFVRGVCDGHIDPSVLLPEYWGESSLECPSATGTLQIEEGTGVLTSQPPPCFVSAPAPGAFPMLPVVPSYERTTANDASPSSPDSSGCQRRVHGSQNARFHPANVPQRLSRGMRKTWGPAATGMSLESIVDELRRECVEEEMISTVRDIFSVDFSVDALMRKVSKDESRRYLGGEKGQVYRVLLRKANERFQCRLCHEGPNAMSWKHPRDVVRHLRRDHFGLGDSCPDCNHVVYTTGEMTNHRCKERLVQ